MKAIKEVIERRNTVKKYKEIMDPLTNYFAAIMFWLKVRGVCHSPQQERKPKAAPVLCADLLKDTYCL